MASVRKDFTIKEARDVTLAFEVVADPDQVITGSAIDFWIARHVGSTVPVITKTVGVGGGITITGDLTFEVEIKAEDTENLEGLYYYEVRIEASDGCRVTSTYGYITFEASLIGAAST
jgi:hypothetical protein